EDMVDITVEENFKTVIESGKAVFTLYGQSSEEYPRVLFNQDDEPLTLKVKDIKTLIKQTVFAVSPMETRPILTGVHVTIEDGELIYTATDSHRLSLRGIKIDDKNFETSNVVIPGKSLQELNKIFDNDDETVN